MIGTSVSPLRRSNSARGFTLVELLVVITVIGILMGMLLPAVSAITEASRNTKCKGHLREMGLALRSHCEKTGAFPTGGTVPWAAVDDYVTKEGIPYGAERQGLGWAFQILPYLELETVVNIAQLRKELIGGDSASGGAQMLLQKIVIPLYFCPSRRRPTIRENPLSPPEYGPTALIDYAAATPGDIVDKRFCNCQAGNPNDLYREEDPNRVPTKKKYNGVIVRTNVVGKSGASANSTPSVVSLAMVHNNLSTTLMIGEKRVEKDHYFSGDKIYDDRGWSAGWSPNIIRSTGFPPGQDFIVDEDKQREQIGFAFGAPHSAGFNAVFVDGHVQAVSYNIDRTLFNVLGHRDISKYCEQYVIDETQL